MNLWKKGLSLLLSASMAVTVFSGMVMLSEDNWKANAYEAGSGVNLNYLVADGGAAVSYSSISNYDNGKTANQAFDGNGSTLWQPHGDNRTAAWVQVSYDGLYEISSVRLDWYNIYPNGESYIEYSTDGSTWDVAYAFTATSNADITATFPPVKASHLRLTTNGSTDSKYGPELYEFEAYGEPTTTDEEEDVPVAEGTLTSKYVKILGKALNETKNGENGYTFTYGGSGIQVNFVGTELKMHVSGIVDWSSGVNMMVSVDTDMPMEATKLTVSETGWVTVVSGLEDMQHTVTITKQSRGFGGIVASEWISISNVSTDGTLLPADPVSDLVIEVYGDSISNGDATWLNENGSNSAYTAASYSTVVGRLLGADTRVTGNTGNGLKGWVMAGGNSNLMIENLLPPQNSWNVFDPNYRSTTWDHSGANAADVVIINLGTNDSVEFGVDLSRKVFADEYVRFIKQIKTDCPDAIVICTLGAMGAVGTWYPCIAGDGSDYYAYSYTRLTVSGDTVNESTVTGYVEADRKDAFLSTIEAHTATATGENGEYLVADVEALDYDVIVKADSLVIDETASHDDNVLTQCNSWAGEEFVYWTQLAACSSIGGGLGYDNGHPSNVAHEIYGLQIATLINEKLGLGKTLPSINDYIIGEFNPDLTKEYGLNYTSSSNFSADTTASSAFDNDTNTKWQAGNNSYNGAWIQIELTDVQTFGYAAIQWGSINAQGTATLEVSTDGAQWITVGTGLGSTSNTVEGVSFAATSAKYLRLTVNGSSDSKYSPDIQEIEIYHHDPALDTGALFTVSKTVAQRSSNSTKNVIRLIAAVNATDFVDNVSTEFWQVGFEITVSDGDHDYTNTRSYYDHMVYDSVGGVDAAALDVAGGKVFAFTITDVPEDCELRVRAYAIDANDNVIYGYQEYETVIRMTGGILTVRN